MNRKRIHSNWFICLLLLGLTIIVLELDYLMPMSTDMRQLLLVIGIILLLATGATYLYQRAQSSRDPNPWWQDDDWTRWGGI